MDSVILHCDLNNFFASVECLFHPEYRDVPMAVCGSQDDRHGIVLAKNEPAKAFGVKTAETIWQAQRKCPGLVIAPPHMEEYLRFSKRAQEVYGRYTDLIEPFGIDECWLDVTGSRLLFGSGEEIANRLREDMKRELGLTISVGVSFNKVFAKLGSDYKKPDAVTCITRENFRQIVWPLSANEMIGVGPATSQRLARYGIRTIGDIAKTDLDFLIRTLGKSGEQLWYCANGRQGLTVARQDAVREVKSIGNSTTYRENLLDDSAVRQGFLQLAESVSERMRRQGFLCREIQISVKDCDLAVKEAQCFLPDPGRHPRELTDTAMQLFSRLYRWEKPVRALGLRAIQLLPEEEGVQYSLLSDTERRLALDRLEGQVSSLRERFGKQAIKRASLLNDGEKKPSSPGKKED